MLIMDKLHIFAVAVYNSFSDVNAVEIIEGTDAKTAILKHSQLGDYDIAEYSLEEVLEIIRNCDQTVGYIELTQES